MSKQYLDADEVIALLGIRKSTLYSYVSRGLIRSQETGGPTRARRYLATDVQALQQRKEQRRNPAKAAATALHFGDPVLESAITLIADGRLYYRGQDALRLAAERHFEEVATLLWTGTALRTGKDGEMAGANERTIGKQRFPFETELLSTIRALVAQDHLAEALQMALLATAPTDLAAYNQSVEAVVKTGLRILDCLTTVLTDTTLLPGTMDMTCVVDQVAVPMRVVPNGASIAQRLHYAWAAQAPQITHVLDAALILCADHELNASSFTARCVASTGSTPYAAVVAALAALQGYKHGGATREAAIFLREAAANPERATQERLRASGRLPGFGHRLYPQGDPRAKMLLALAQHHCADAPALATAEQIIAVARQAMQLEPNLDFGLTVLAQSAGYPDHAPFALFALGRAAGWIGHIIEEYQADRLIRPRAHYHGRQPQQSSNP